MTEGEMGWDVFKDSGIRIENFSEVSEALGLSTVSFTVTFADVNRVMQLFEEDGRRERQRRAGRLKMRAALRRGELHMMDRASRRVIRTMEQGEPAFEAALIAWADEMAQDYHSPRK